MSIGIKAISLFTLHMKLTHENIANTLYKDDEISVPCKKIYQSSCRFCISVSVSGVKQPGARPSAHHARLICSNKSNTTNDWRETKGNSDDSIQWEMGLTRFAMKEQHHLLFCFVQQNHLSQGSGGCPFDRWWSFSFYCNYTNSSKLMQ